MNTRRKNIKKNETHKSKIKNLLVDKDGSIRKIIICLIFAAIGFIIYSNTLQSPFTFDDTAHIPNNPHIRITELNLKNILDAAFKSPSFSRPVSNISFALNYYFHRYNLTGYHLTNIFIHILTGIFLYYLFKNTLSLPLLRQKIKNPEWLSLAASVLWLVHPLQTQSVTYIVQRMNSLAAMFYILSLLLYVKGRLAKIKVSRGWPWFIGCLTAGICAIGSKEIAATLPVFILLYEWFFFENLNTKWLKKQIPYIVVIFVLFALLGFLYLGPNPLNKITSEYNRWDFTVKQRYLTQPRVIIFYLSLVFFPVPSRLNLDHDFALSYSLLNPPTTIVAIALVLALIIIAFYLAKKNRLLSFCIFWFFVNLAIESFLVSIEMVYEHRMYLPSMFLILAIVVLIWRLIKIQWIKLVVFPTIIILFGTATLQRNTVWANGLTLWSDCAAKSPNKPRPQYNLANELRKTSQTNEAIRYYNKAIELDPNYFKAHTNLALLLLDLGKKQQALEHCRTALKLKPNHHEALFHVGLCFYQMQDYQQAAEKWEQAAKIAPKWAKVYSSLGKAYYQQKNYEKAESAWNKAFQLEKDRLEVVNNLAHLHLVKGDIATAVTLFEKSLSIKADQIETLNNLAWILSTNIKYQNDPNSVLFAEKACRITNYQKPNFLDTLAAAYASTGEFQKAVETAQKAVQLAETEGNKKLADEIRRRIEFYKARRSYQQIY